MLSRRTFLRAVGLGAIASSAPGLVRGAAHAQPPPRPSRFVMREDRFGRMFPQLRSFAEPSARLQEALLELGKPGGPLDARDALDRGPIDLIADPALSAGNPNNTGHTAGETFVGQFIDHDMTFDLGSRLGVPAEPRSAANARTPALDLDSVYGGGPLQDPDLYVSVDRRSRLRPTRFKVETNGAFEDLPRGANSVAIIADPRNDENLMIAGLHAAVLLFHNAVVDRVGGRRDESPEDVFRRARTLTTWHYQWMVVHEFLPLFIGQATVDDILRRGRRFYRPNVGYMPVEFQGAAYRFGHSLVRPSYRANLEGDHGQPFFGMIFDPVAEGQADPIDLRGGVRAPRRFVGWQTFFDFGLLEAGGGAPAVKPNKRIDTKISSPLMHLPVGTIAGTELGVTSLPQRNLLRHVTWRLPSGQSIARAMEAPVLSREDLSDLRDFGLDASTPLWYYVLREADVMAAGAHLGPVGGRIVGEVILGLLQLDPDSYLSAGRRWTPTLPQRSGRVTGDFRMVDFLAFAGVDPASRGQ
jgi:hypothetical protein